MEESVFPEHASRGEAGHWLNHTQDEYGGGCREVYFDYRDDSKIQKEEERR